MEWKKNIFAHKTKYLFFSQIPATQTPDDIEVKTLSPNKEYLNVILKSMRIVNVRRGLSKFYATVHSHIELNHFGSNSISFNCLTTPGNLEKLDATRIDRVVNMNRRLLGPVPYLGGDVKMEIGLFSVKEAELAAPFIRLLSSMSSLGGVSFVNMALPYVKPLEEGIALLTGSSDNTILEIGINTELDVVKTGYFVLMRADKDEIDTSNLIIDKNDYRLVDRYGNAIKDYPYMVLEISSSRQREDWSKIPDVLESYRNLQAEVKKGNYNNVSEALSSFKRIICSSSDLLIKDGKRIYSEVESRIKEVFITTQTRANLNLKLPELSEFKIY